MHALILATVRPPWRRSPPTSTRARRSSPAGRRGWRRSSPSCASAPRSSRSAAAPPRVERHRARGKMTARERIDRLVDPGTAFLELGALAAWGLYDGEAPSAGIVTGIGVVEGQPCVDLRERRDREGRHLLPADGEEAPARAGGRRAEPPAVPLPRRLRRRVPAAPGRRLPRSRPLRAALLQPGAHVGARGSRRSRS